MANGVAEFISPWHDFYMLLGTASATLVGLMFVAASVGASYYTARHEEGMRTFISPTVVHFSAVLVICLLAVMPVHNWYSLGSLLAGGGLASLLYAGWSERGVWQRWRRGEVEFVDILWYALIPTVAYLLVTAAGASLLLRATVSTLLLAAALIMLLLAGLRNAWDMTLWIVIRAGKQE